MNKTRLKELDILRAIAFIFVVAQHTIGGFSNVNGINFFEYAILKFLYVMAKTAVPIFLFISGVSLFYVYSNRFDWKKYYIKRFEYICIPYIVWSAINMFKLGNIDRFRNFIVQVIAGNGGYHLWYMGMIIRVYLTFPIILFVVRKIHSMDIKIRKAVFMFLVASYYLVSKYQNSIADNISFFIFGNPSELQHKIVNISILFWYLYFALGIYFALNYNYLKNKVLQYKGILLGGYFLLFIYAYLGEVNIIGFVRGLSLLYPVFSILAFYIICVFLSDKNIVYNIMSFIGKYSFVSYMAHIIVINYVVNEIRIKVHIQDFLALGLLAWTITTVITPIMFSIISCIPYSHYITGVKNKKSILNIINLLNKSRQYISKQAEL